MSSDFFLHCIFASAGTPLGDPIEVGALAEVCGTAGSTLTVMACKSALGHAEPAAGEVVRQRCDLRF